MKNTDFFAQCLEDSRVTKELIDAFDAEIIIEQGSKMVSDAQIKFFDKLLSEKDFGDNDVETLRENFAKLNQKSGSTWIESALQLPKLDESKEEITPAPFG